MDEIPKPPPAPDFKSPSTGPNLLADPIFDNVRSIFYDLEKEESSDSKEHSNWLETEAGRKDVQEAHAELMSAILRFDKFKESKESTHSKQQPIRLKGKHTSRVDLFFERKNPDGLRRIRRHIQEMMEFFQNALDKNQTKLEVEDLSQSVMFDMGASLIRDTNNVDNMTKAIEDALAYLETYLMYLKPRLEQLANQQKFK
ncbi:MAG: hypothetical protein HWD61_14975 [Parachlamydiaceae bacterium]|nr:MAG: hypothetical protein HWD61_14975 [Parachlamydiaceae bacterium]